MDSSLISERLIWLLNADGTPAPHPREWFPMWVELGIEHADWEQVSLARNGEPLAVGLRRLGGKVRVIAEWPRSGPGGYQLAFRLGGLTEVSHVEVRPEKLSPASFDRLVEDLESLLPASVALGLQRLGGLSGLKLLPPQQSTLAEEVLRLRRAILGDGRRPGLAMILERVASEPHRMLSTSELWVPRHRARRPHPARIPQALLLRGNLTANRLPVRVADTRVEHTFDVYENRLLKSYASLVERRARRLRSLLKRAGDEPLRTDLDALLTTLARARRQAAFLDEVSGLTGAVTTVTMVLLKRPEYRAALEGLLEFQRRMAVHLESSALETPLENLPYLYQLWGTLQVVDALLEVGREAGLLLVRERLVGRAVNGLFLHVLPNGEPAVVLRSPGGRTEVQLIPERSYGKDTGLHSITFSQRPDVALEIRRGDSVSVLLFDPKYKLDGDALDESSTDLRPKKVDIDKMHAYRDSIRDADARRVVSYAAIMYPGPEVRYATSIDALHAVPGSEGPLKERLREVLREALAGKAEEC